jgi:hypothetical protein
MTDLTQFVPELNPEPTLRESRIVEPTHTIIKGCTFEEARDMAIQCRKTHPDESVGWYKCDNNTYIVFGDDR